MIGASLGIPAGPGVIFADIRYAGDFQATGAQFTSVNGTPVSGTLEDYFTRGKFPVTIGYEIGLISKGGASGGNRKR